MGQVWSDSNETGSTPVESSEGSDDTSRKRQGSDDAALTPRRSPSKKKARRERDVDVDNANDNANDDTANANDNGQVRATATGSLLHNGKWDGVDKGTKEKDTDKTKETVVERAIKEILSLRAQLEQSKSRLDQWKQSLESNTKGSNMIINNPTNNNNNNNKESKAQVKVEQLTLELTQANKQNSKLIEEDAKKSNQKFTAIQEKKKLLARIERLENEVARLKEKLKQTK
jgi:hypothetical protein